MLFLPNLLPVYGEEFIPVWIDISVFGRSKVHSFANVVESPAVVRRLPPEVNAPTDVIRHIRETGKEEKSSIFERGPRGPLSLVF